MDLDHLIIVCCHAIYVGGPLSGNSEDEWLIEPFQKGETPTFINHVKAGLHALVADRRGLLVFSGGPTKKSRTDIGEGQSYLNLCKDNHLFDYPADTSRIVVEPHATDSYQNILFSLLRFYFHAGAWPRRVTVITHEFKRARFMDCHFPALGLLPPSVHEAQNMKFGHVGLIGINPPEEVTPLESLIRGENSKGISLWKQDSYGVGDELARKRKNRGWSLGMEKNIFFDQGLGQVVEKLLCWDGGAGNKLFPQLKELPWFYGNVK